MKSARPPEEGKPRMDAFDLQMFGLRAKLAMAQECHLDGTFNGARYCDVCRSYRGSIFLA